MRFEVKHLDILLTLKVQVENTNGFPVEQQKFVYQGRPVYDNYTFDENKIKDGTLIHVVLKSFWNKIYQSAGNKDWDDNLICTNKLPTQTTQQMRFHPSLSVHFGNILDVIADCIVNPANEGLLGGGGIDYLIHQAAGPKLAQFCSELPTDFQGIRCPIGHSVITPGFMSKYKFIVHTVGPSLDAQGRTQPTLLANCYTTAFKLAVDQGCRSIVFPTIATGFYGYPMLEAAQIAIKTLNTVLEQQETANSMKVCVAVFNDTEQDIWRKLLNN